MQNKKNTLFEHLEFHTAPVFLLLLIVLAIFFVGNSIGISPKISTIIAFACFIFGTILAILKHKNFAFYALAISVSFFLFTNSEETKIHFSNKIILSQKAIISGSVKKIIKSDENNTRILVNGWLDTKELPRIYNNGIILNIYKNGNPKEIHLGSKILANCNVRPPNRKVFENDFDEMRYAQGLNANWVGWVSSSKIIVTDKANNFEQMRNFAYKSISDKIIKTFDATTATIVKAILLGDKSNLDAEIKESFAITGVAHILALSGLHIGIISGIFLILLSLFSVNRWLKFIIFTLLVTSFVFLTGMQDSAIRAGGMAILFMLAFTLQREANPLNIISAVTILAIVISPSMLYSLSFQLSVLSIFGIVIFYLVFKNFFLIFTNSENRLIEYLINSIAMTFSASVIIVPIIAYYFNIFSIISPLANLIIVPLFLIGLIFSVVTIAFSYIFFPLAEIYSGCVELIFKLCVIITKFAASFDFSAISNHQNLVLIAILSSICLIYIFTSRKRRQLFFRLIICCLFFPMIIYLSENHEQIQPEIFAKERYCLLSIPLSGNEKFVWLADRKPSNFEIKHFDRGLINYFENDKSIKYIGISGNFGNQFVENILLVGGNSRKYKIRKLSFAEQREIENRYLNGKYISQITTMKNKYVE